MPTARKKAKPPILYGVLVNFTRSTTGRKVQTMHHYADGAVVLDPNRTAIEALIDTLRLTNSAKYSLVEIHGVPDASNP